MSLIFLVLCLYIFNIYSQNIPNEEFGYHDVRSGAHMFYWFYGSTNANVPRNELPIVLWLQGGPGAGGTGYGNFGEFGPLNTTLQPRDITWLSKVNLLFIDNPVGAGYSYVDNVSLLTTDNTQIAQDLLTMHQYLVKTYKFMETLPYYIFSESYGGKMTATFGNVLYDAIQSGSIMMNFKGVTLGDSWIQGVAYVNTWPDYLRAFTLIDDAQYKNLTDTANACQEAINQGNWLESTHIWGAMEGQISNYTDNVDFYYSLQFEGLKPQTINNSDYLSILKHNHLTHLDEYLFKLGGGVNESQISYIMNHQVKEQLGIIPNNVQWGGQSNAVFSAQETDFMKPVIKDVTSLLQKGINVNIINGQLDLICCTLGTLYWIEQMTWEYINEYQNATKIPVLKPDKSDVAYFKQSYKNFAFYYIMKAGHMVPADNPIAAIMALEDITGLNDI
mmetsp:Transcript_13116/g.16210  ORF Transcript_13116/g.16210 Transcript_13116/m.16210 type:complete len:446 (-) Transcript_13116:104-1441(-)